MTMIEGLEREDEVNCLIKCQLRNLYLIIDYIYSYLSLSN